ncbi:MAG: UDP-N-acetylglucosamine--undecaprenyl-phosphate N-acetylglucosaminephosphotransferase, partial [Marinobacter sp.]|nr:UDP-N-acetylglucosamine--undecaprenyl-phosphate N-acetylglucosaminephosphotransferase [Marinobacter sp.]
WLGPLITIAAVIGATNAFNMIDGIDGLAGSMSLVTLLSLSFLFLQAPGNRLELALAFSIAIALLPYLAANLRMPPFKKKIFMGDAGSMFIGFSIVWLLVKGTQPETQALRPVTALWIIAIPLMDMVAIMVRRARKGQSVMKPDREHLHHIFMRAGFTDRESLLVITLVSLVFASIGLAGERFQVPEWLMFTLFVGMFAAYDWVLSHAWRLLVLFRKRRHL